MFRIDTTVIGYLAAAVMISAGGLWIIFDSPSHPILRQLVGVEAGEGASSIPATREQISDMRHEVEAARDALRRAEKQGGRSAMQEALKRYDQAQRRYTAARLQALQSTSHEVEGD